MDKKVILLVVSDKDLNLWPLTLQDKPKALLDLDGKKPLIKTTYDNVKTAFDNVSIYICGEERYRENIITVLDDDFEDSKYLLPVGNSNGILSVYSCCRKIFETEGDCLISLLTCDFFADNMKYFMADLERGFDVARGKREPVLIGIKPRYPGINQIYIEKEDAAAPKEKGGYKIHRFVANPSREKAKKYLKDGKYLWYNNIIVSPLGVILDFFEKTNGKIGEFIGKKEGEQNFQLDPDSVDSLIRENKDWFRVIEGEAAYNKISSYGTIVPVLKEDGTNAVLGDVTLQDVQSSIIIGDKCKIAVMGMKDIIAVEKNGIVFICPYQKIRDIPVFAKNME